MKNIAVLIENYTSDYAQEALLGIIEYFSDKDTNVISVQTKYPNCYEGLFEDQYWAMAKLMNSKMIDGVISISAEYTSCLSPEEFSNYLSFFSGKPFVSMGIELPLSFDSSFTFVSCERAYDEIVTYLIKGQGCKKYLLLTGGKTKSIENANREKAFYASAMRQGLKEEDITNVPCNFTFHGAKYTLEDMFPKGTDFPYDAIVALNDRMALAAMEFLSEREITIPNTVKIIGFDNSLESKASIPTLSTITQEIGNQGREAAKLLYEKMNGFHPERGVQTNVWPLYRMSTGNMDVNEFHLGYSLDSFAQRAFYSSTSIMKVYHLLNHLHTSNTLEMIAKYYGNILYTVKEEIKSFSVVLYDSFVCNEDITTFEIPDKASLYRFNDKTNKYTKEEIFPKETLFPIESDKNEHFFLHPIFFQDKQYGYIIASILNINENSNMALLFMKVISFIFASSFESNSKFDNMSKNSDD